MPKSENSDHNCLNSSTTDHIPLLEEQLQVTRRQRKIGEVVIRKQVETQMVQVPIRREKLIVERIGQNPQQLAEIVVGSETVNGYNYEEIDSTNSLHITKSNFLDLSTAQALLKALEKLEAANNAKIRLEIVTNCPKSQIEHQELCDRY